MKLTVLGCAGTFPGAASGCSSYLLEHDGFRLMVDCGYGAVGALQRHGDLLDLDAVLLSHLHADHCVDLVGYAYARFYHPTAHPLPLPVWGPRGTEARIQKAMESSRTPWLNQVYDWRELTAGDHQIGPFHITAQQVAHPVECYGLRIEAGGRTLTYSADTGPCDVLVELARDADLFLCEASFVEHQDNPVGVHLTGAQAGRAAVDAGARSLLLTHLVAWHDEAVVLGEAKDVYPGELRLARCGVTYPV
ncbi:MAG TPA: MBL fold metallo-hydrolase [Mycobacteriales bacterium]|nr:MBL fold metallo-hydrolase [Mycobacteriales bacterium]